MMGTHQDKSFQLIHGMACRMVHDQSDKREDADLAAFIVAETVEIAAKRPLGKNRTPQSIECTRRNRSVPPPDWSRWPTFSSPNGAI
ncbi:hypothetical protein RB1093 [Rhodopirellula baltica SH 1]|uniref:Uncharacterized protein n=1 Tax=Rhodopirellula baltica (strain DSM 10527 / NCIMB 13988 / SH1) TaxID=243090 RepID=Q7UXV1_RHOBA|nr:hypothetical protein RB1093 [Rhodopirellula baltica SH 1]